MSKEYRYRKHIRWGQYVIPVFFGIIFLVTLVTLVPIISLEDLGSSFSFVIVALFGVDILLLLVGGGGSWYLYYRLAGISVSFDGKGVVYKHRGGIKHLPFESLRIESASIKYTGGWAKLISGKEVIRLTVVIEDISGFLVELKAALDSRGLSSHYDSRKLFAFTKTAVAADQSWDRAYAIFGKLFLIIFVVGITLVNGYVFGTIGFGFLFIVLWGFFSLFWILGVYIIAEIILMRKIAKQSDEIAFTFPSRDIEYEKQVYTKAINWGGWLYVLLSLLVMIAAPVIIEMLFPS